MAINTTKILLVITKGNWGGAQKYVYDLATSLPSLGYEVLVAYGEGDTLPKKLAEAKIPSRQIPSLGRDVSFFKDASVFWSLSKLFQKEKPDVVHLNSSKIGGLGALAARLSGVRRIVFTVHGFAFNEDRPWLQKKIIGFLSWLTVIFSTDVICISKTEYEIARQWPFAGKKIHLVPNGISAPEFLERETARKNLAEKIGKPEAFFENNKVVVSIGELTKNKGYEYAIPAFKNLPNFAYVIIGAGEERANLEKIISENNLVDRVALAGFVAGASSLLKSADVFLLSSVKEGLPYVILEAGLARLPVIATRIGGIPDVIEDNVTGILVPSKDSGIIYSALTRFGGDENFRNSCAFRLEQKILSEHSKETMLKNTISVYNI